MNAPEQKLSRRDHILQALAAMLESHPGSRITTAALAKEVGVTEAALYRHFPSKAKMFEGLIEFIESVIFSNVTLILQEQSDVRERLRQILNLVLVFTERNPGITRVMNGDALVGENERLQARVGQFFERLETQIKQVLRDADLRDNVVTAIPSYPCANLLMAVLEGRISQFVRSGFRRKPTENWEAQWEYLAATLFRDRPAS